MKRRVHLVQINDVIGGNIILPLAIGILWQAAMSSKHNRDHWELGQVIYKKLDSPNQLQEIGRAHV